MGDPQLPAVGFILMPVGMILRESTAREEEFMGLQKSKTAESRMLVAKVSQKTKTRKTATRVKATSGERGGWVRGLVQRKPVTQELQRQPVYVEAAEPQASAFVFLPCSLRGPDGKERSGWEMWVGDMMFGRADSKETLMAYYSRLHEPLPSGHWRERTWQQQKRRPTVSRRGDVHDEEDEEGEFDLDDMVVEDNEE